VYKILARVTLVSWMEVVRLLSSGVVRVLEHRRKHEADVHLVVAGVDIAGTDRHDLRKGVGVSAKTERVAAVCVHDDGLLAVLRPAERRGVPQERVGLAQGPRRRIQDECGHRSAGRQVKTVYSLRILNGDAHRIQKAVHVPTGRNRTWRAAFEAAVRENGPDNRGQDQEHRTEHLGNIPSSS